MRLPVRSRGTLRDWLPVIRSPLTVDATVQNTLPNAATSFTNYARVFDDGANGSDPSNDNEDFDTNLIGGTAVPDYEITKQDGVSAVTPGQSLTYNILARNVGGATWYWCRDR